MTDLTARVTAKREYILLALMEAGSMYRDGAESFLAEYDAAVRTAVLSEAAENDGDEQVRCGHPHCPNGERFRFAAERGWVAWPHGAWSCPQHAVIPTR